MHDHKNFPSVDPLFSGIIMGHPILHISAIRVNYPITYTIEKVL